MSIILYTPEKIKLPELSSLTDFLQKIISRAYQGYCRYGRIDANKKYLTRLQLELKAYKKYKNQEHLYNIAVYAWLELVAPESKKVHYNPKVDSVTRGKI